MNCWRTPSDAVTDASSRNCLHVLPRAHARALGPLRLERRVDRERHVEILRGREHRIVVGMAERPAVVRERRDVRAARAFADARAPARAAAAAGSLSERCAVGTSAVVARAELADPAVVRARVRLAQLGVVELGLPQQPDRRVEHDGVDAFGVEHFDAARRGPCCRTALRGGRCVRGRAASTRRSGSPIAPSVDGKPLRLILDRSPPISSSSRPFSSGTMRSARSRYFGSRYVSHRSGGSRMWPSASTAPANDSRFVSCIGFGIVRIGDARDRDVNRECSMRSFAGRLAVVTGGGSGMGAELVVQLAAEGCSVATCDIRREAVEETARRAAKDAPAGTSVTAHGCDVADEAPVERSATRCVAQHGTDHINLLFNNAGIGGGGSFVLDDREEWDRTFAVVLGRRVRLQPRLRAVARRERRGLSREHEQRERVLGIARSGHAAHGVQRREVRGEGVLRSVARGLRDQRAARARSSVVMPGHIGTDIVINSRTVHGAAHPDAMTAERHRRGSRRVKALGYPMATSRRRRDAHRSCRCMGEQFRDDARRSPQRRRRRSSSTACATRSGASSSATTPHLLDEKVRADPENAYGPDGISLASIVGSAAGKS